MLVTGSEAAEFDFLAKSTWKWGMHKMCDIFCPFSVNSTKSSRCHGGLGFKMEHTLSYLPSETELCLIFLLSCWSWVLKMEDDPFEPSAPFEDPQMWLKSLGHFLKRTHLECCFPSQLTGNGHLEH